MSRVSTILLRLSLVAAFVPVLLGGLTAPTPSILLVFLVLAGVSAISLRLWASKRGKPFGILLALAACVTVWSMAALAIHGGPPAPPISHAP